MPVRPDTPFFLIRKGKYFAEAEVRNSEILNGTDSSAYPLPILLIRLFAFRPGPVLRSFPPTVL